MSKSRIDKYATNQVHNKIHSKRKELLISLFERIHDVKICPHCDDGDAPIVMAGKVTSSFLNHLRLSKTNDIDINTITFSP